MPIVTLLFLIRDRQILLAMKKRGTGQGKWNGVGGKVAEGEDIGSATIRECEEEIGVKPKNLAKVAELEFFIPSQNFKNLAHVYIARAWEGEIIETEEMAPKWFDFEAIPYDQMWSDDRLWLPRVLQGERLKASFVFDKDELIVKSTINREPSFT